MSKNEKKMIWDVSGDNKSDKPRLSSEHLMGGEYEASEILKKYLQGLKYCGQKKRHRCISQELER
jgi:hypothetical protein